MARRTWLGLGLGLGLPNPNPNPNPNQEVRRVARRTSVDEASGRSPAVTQGCRRDDVVLQTGCLGLQVGCLSLQLERKKLQPGAWGCSLGVWGCRPLAFSPLARVDDDRRRADAC